MTTKTAVFKKLAWVMQLYEAFHLTQNLGVNRRVSEGVAKSFMKIDKKVFLFFEIYDTTLKFVTYIMSYTDMHHW